MHFGQATDVQDQISMMHESLDQFSAISQVTDAREMTDWIRAWVTERAGPEAADYYWRAGPFEGMWSGFDLYWKRQAT